MRSRKSPTGAVARRLVAAGGAAVLLATSLAACSGGGDGSATVAEDSSAGSIARDGASGGSGGAKAGTPEEATERAGGSTGSGSSTAARVLPTDRDIVYRGSISVRVADVGRAADRVEGLVLDADGVVFTEQTTTDPRHPEYGEATMTVRVPPTLFGATLDAIGRLGKEQDRARSAEDVTGQVTDTDSRVRTQRRSVDRVRVLLARAETIGEVVQIESELSRREADLESLEAQLERLQDMTSLATIEVRLYSPDRTPAPAPDDSDLGFLAGLGGGWDAFVGIVLVGLTVLGALVPFAVTAALVGLPGWLVWRARRRTPAPTPTP